MGVRREHFVSGNWRIAWAAVILGPASAFVLACESASPEEVRQGCAAIVSGSPDGTHTNAVALIDSQERLLCSGALIVGRGNRGVVLTAAHCLDDVIDTVTVGADFRSSDRRRFVAVKQVSHPGFRRETGEYDFGVVFLRGPMDESSDWLLTPEQDVLAMGTPIQFVGFGADLTNAPNSIRNSWTGHISKLTETTFEYDQSGGGPCLGDSGGPGYARLADGKQVLAGVTSFGDPSCKEYGVSGRVSVAMPFIASLLASEGFICWQ